MHSKFIPCKELHPFQPRCTMLVVEQWFLTFKKGVKLYAPIFILPAILLRRKGIQHIVKHTLPEVLRSAAFLGTFASSYAGFMCLLRNLIVRQDIPSNSYIAGFLAGLCSILIERKSRRAELALYCMNQSMGTLWSMLENRGIVRSRKDSEIFIFMLASAIMYYFYQNEPDSMRSNMHGLFKFFVGVN
eukprot:TRINITY_DN382_c0_g3_i1.p1 TRINITY_DN382_c0_g3~~TRINITY_DN382_c0_g3_i1.p1  ORF type:complete len:188 (-),score=11.78 TRINITY_DN382_c0_g3_i1:67-630(-)